MFKEIAKSMCLDRQNVTLRTVAYGDNFHITVEGAGVNAAVAGTDYSLVLASWAILSLCGE